MQTPHHVKNGNDTLHPVYFSIPDLISNFPSQASTLRPSGRNVLYPKDAYEKNQWSNYQNNDTRNTSPILPVLYQDLIVPFQKGMLPPETYVHVRLFL